MVANCKSIKTKNQLGPLLENRESMYRGIVLDYPIHHHYTNTQLSIRHTISEF